MPQEAFCPEHGPYDASLGNCPYPHAGMSPRPRVPIPLDDDLPLDDDPPTEIPTVLRSRRGILDFDEEEATELPRSAHEDLTELDVPVKGVFCILWVKEGSRRGRFYPISHSTIIGRKEGAIILDDPKVSGMHAKFTIEDNAFVIWDLGSANGTYVNGKKIREATILDENDTIKIGETLLVVKLLDPKPKNKSSRTSKKR